MMEQADSVDSDIIPIELVEQLTKNQINLIGETHGIQENQQFYDQLIPLLHDQGIRQIAIERQLALSLPFDQYVRGELATIPWRYEDISLEDIPILESVKNVNQDLRDRGLAEDQIRLLTFDTDLTQSNAFYHMLLAMKRLGLHPDFSTHLNVNQKLLDQGTSPGLSDELNRDFIWIQQQEVKSQDKLLDYNPMSDGVKYDQKWKDLLEFREAFLAENVAYFRDQLAEGEKMLVITGLGHAAKEGGLTSEIYFSETPLAKRLNEIYPEQVHSTAILSYTQQIVHNNQKVLEQDTVFETAQGDLISSLKQVHGDRMVWLGLDRLPPGKIDISISYSDGEMIFKGNVRETFDTIIFLPIGTLQNPL